MIRRAARAATLIALTVAAAACGGGTERPDVASATTSSGAIPPLTADPTTTSSATTTSRPRPTTTSTARSATTTTATTTSTTTTTTTSPASTQPPPDTDAPVTTVAPSAVVIGISPDATTEERGALGALAERGALLASGSNAVGGAIARAGAMVGSFVVGHDVTGAPLTLSARFRLASVSKLLTTLTVLRLADDGRIDLDRPLVQQWVTLVAPVDARFNSITPRQLLQHTSGIKVARKWFFGNEATDWHDVAARSVSLELDADPGTHFAYSNVNFVLLGSLIEQVTGQSYADAIDAAVLHPLGITTAATVGTEEQPPGDAAYGVTAGRRYMEALGPAGAWVMTATDTAKVTAAFDPASTPRIVSAAGLDVARTWNGVPSDQDDWLYGAGLMLGHGWIGHTGTVEGARTMVFDLPNGYQVVLLAATEVVGSGGALGDYFAAQVARIARLR